MIIKNFGYLYHSNKKKNILKYKICLINLIEKNNALLITNDKNSSILYGLLKLSVNNINIELSSSSFLSTINYEKIKKYKIVIYDLKDGGNYKLKSMSVFKIKVLDQIDILFLLEKEFDKFKDILYNE